MKKIKHLLSAIIFCTFLSGKAYAIFPDLTPMIPFSPQLCPQCLPPAIMTVTGTIAQVKEIKKDLLEETNVTKLKQMLTSYAAQMGETAFNSALKSKFERDKVVSSARSITSQSHDNKELKDVNYVRDKFIKLFLQYPSEKENVTRTYKQKSEDLKVDTVVEMYMVANSMQEKLYGKKTNQDANNSNFTEEDLAKIGLLEQLELINGCLMENKNCDKIGLTSCLAKKSSNSDNPSSADTSNEDQVCFWNSALQAMRIYDTLMRYNETLAALQAQYRAVMSIDTLGHIKEYKEQSPQSYLEEKYRKNMNGYAVSELKAEKSFARDDYSEELKRYNSKLSTTDNTIEGNFYIQKDAKGFESALDNKDEDVKAMKILENAFKNMNKAMAMHNMKQLLPNYRRVYQTHKEIKEYHDKTMDNLRISGECIQNFLEPYYGNIKRVWFGNKACDYQKDDEKIKEAVKACKESDTMHERDCENLVLRGNLYCHYTPERNPEDIQEGEHNKSLYNIICPDDEKHICKVVEYNSDVLDQGLSGYMMALYKESKIQAALGNYDTQINAENRAESERSYTAVASISDIEGGAAGSDDYITLRDENVANDKDDMHGGNMQLNKLRQLGKQRSGNVENDNTKNQKNADEEADKIRADSLIFWQLGNDTIDDIAKGIELGNGANSFGTASRAFPLWNDQKEFYNQYVDGKYNNIESYIRNMIFGDALLNIAQGINSMYPYEDDVDDEGNVVKSADEKRQEEAAKIAANNIPEIEDPTPTIQAMLKAEREKFKKMEEEHKKKIKSLKKQREELYKEKDAYSSALSQKNSEYNANNEVDLEAGKNSEESEFGTEYSKEIYKNRKLSGVSVQDKNFMDTQTSGRKSQAVAKANKLAAMQTKSIERSLERAKSAVIQMNNSIEAERKNFAKEYSDEEIEARKKFVDFVIEYAEKMPNEEVETAIDSSIMVAYADGLMNCSREYALLQVKIAKKKINNLKMSEQLYYPSQIGKLHEIHKDLIDSITQINLDDVTSVCGDLVSELSELGINVGALFPELNLFSNICKNVDCYAEDDNYFVGVIARDKDFTAPKRAVTFQSAPLREVFHFDVIDFNNIEKDYESADNVSDNKSLTTNMYSFLHPDVPNDDYEIPEIWEYVLTHHAFVEKEIDLIHFFGNDEEDRPKGNPEKAYLRAGIYPCLIGKNVIDADMSGGASLFPGIINSLYLSYTINKTKDLSSYYTLPQCTPLQLHKSWVYDIEAPGSTSSIMPMKTRGTVALSSELGHILTYIPQETKPVSLLFNNNNDKAYNTIPKAPMVLKEYEMTPHKLSFNSVLLRAIQNTIDTESIGEDEEKDAEYYLSKRTFLDRNQLGDFLNIVEMEEIAMDSLRKVENQLETIEHDIGAILIDADFTVGNDYSLLKEEDFNATAEALDGQKSYYIQKAEEYIQQVNGKSQIIIDKLMQLKRQEEAMLTDSEEMIALNGTEEKAELIEQIKTKKADNAIENEYKEESSKKEILPIMPYCAVYRR